MSHFLAKKCDLSFLIEKSNYLWDYFFQLSMGVLGGGGRWGNSKEGAYPQDRKSVFLGSWLSFKFVCCLFGGSCPKKMDQISKKKFS